MKLRKVLALTLALSMTFSLAACGGGSDEGTAEAPAADAGEDAAPADEAEAPAADAGEEAPAAAPSGLTYAYQSW